MTKLLQATYNTLPVAFQNIAISAYGLHWYKRRFGGVFKKELQECIQRGKYNEGQWHDYQNDKLRKILIHAFDTVPYYKNKLTQLGLNRSEILRIETESLKELPILEKETFRSLGTTLLLSKKREPKGLFYPSSGSTGTPTQNLYSLRMHQAYYAIFEARVLYWAGLNYKIPRAVIGGRKIIQDGNYKGPFYRYNMVEKQTYMSAYHLSPHTVEDYVKGIEKHKAAYLTGYASANFFLARFIEETGIRPPMIRAVLTSADKLTEEMRQTFRRVYGCEAFDSYNGVEASCLISECEHHRLHIVPDVGIIEVLNEKGEVCKPGETGEAVTTGLLNYDQPLIRYRMGDIITLSRDMHCKCGRAMPLVDEIVGRVEDTVTGPDGREMKRFHGIFYNIPAIVEGQIVQNSFIDFEINVVTVRRLTDDEINLIKKRMISQLGGVNVEVKSVNMIPRSPNGKFKAVISNVKRGLDTK
jgi:phenylacetate-CoA ligase